jgi:hypothetical protein
MAITDRGAQVPVRPRHRRYRLSIARVLALFAIIVPLMHTTITTAQATMIVSGTTFLDLDDDGVQESRELGLGNVWVRAYNDAGAPAGSTLSSTTAATQGQYRLSLPPGAYRVEFDLSSLPTGANYHPGAQGASNGSSIVIVDSTATVNFGVVQPTRFCQNNPDLATTCHLPGNQVSLSKPVVYTFPYTAEDTTPANPASLAESNEVGTTWGLAYQPTSQSMFISAFLKRHAAFHTADATGAIYRIPDARSATPGTPTLFLDLNALLGAGTTGSDDRVAAPDYHRDETAFPRVGKVALGDMDLAEDGVGLWTVNLASRELYYIPIGVNGTAPTSAAAIQRYPIPLTTALTVDQALCPDVNDARPFAVEPSGGKVYVGLVCSAESSQDAADLKALVYAFDLATQQFSAAPVLIAPLDYQRGCADHAPNVPFGCLPNEPELLADWKPWPNSVLDFRNFDIIDGGIGFVVYPQPWLTDIILDRGSMILALRDRFGDQSGYLELNPTLGDPTNYIGISAGDILRACPTAAGGWTPENNGQCDGLPVAPSGAGNGLGPGGGEYYWQDKHPRHNGITVGGLAQLPSSNEVAVTAFDPLDTLYEGGAIWLNNDNGSRARGYRVFGDDLTTPQPDPRFAKSNGMGDLLALCDAAPVEIGNRVWFDADGDGVQDPSERSLEGIAVELVDASGNVIGAAVTDADGHYYFSNDTRRGSTASERYGIAAIAFGQQYTVRIPLQQTALDTYYVTGQHADASSGGNTRDSDGDNAFAAAGSAAAPGSYTAAGFLVGSPGQNTHIYDFGFTISPTAIALQRLTATRVDTATQIHWVTTAEQGTFGFQIYRSDDGTWEGAILLTPQTILARGGSNGASYNWADTGPPPVDQTRYWLVELETGGASHRYGPIHIIPSLSELPYAAFLPMVNGP